MSFLLRRDTVLTDVETTPFAHRYLIKRPAVKTESHGSRDISLENTHSSSNEHAVKADPAPSIDNPMVEKRRFELFIDLIWVGIVGNLAEHYSQQAFGEDSRYSIGDAFGEFTILFLIAIRMWKNLQVFMTKYHTNDLIERYFVIVYLILAMLYGNNAPYILDTDHPSSTGIVAYLISQVSISIIESVYSLFLPHLRPGILIRVALIGCPAMPFFIVSCFHGRTTRSILLSIGVILQFFFASLIETPLFERWMRQERTAHPWDAGHWIDRIRDFFIIILGEGVLNLIRGSPLGVGLSAKAGAGILGLCQYYMLSSLFFNADGTRRYIHALKRTYWRKSLFMFLNSVIFFSTITLGVSVDYLIEESTSNAVLPVESSEASFPETRRFKWLSARAVSVEEEAKLANNVNNAKWSAGISVSVTVAALTLIALLNRSLDPPKSLKVTNRYLRLAPRLAFIVIAICLSLDRNMIALSFLGIIVGLLTLLMVWELISSLEREGAVLEP